MTIKQYRTFVAGILALLIIGSSFSFVPHPASAASQTGVMVALYTYPDSTWDIVAQAKAAHPSVPVVAIINPNNGPGSSRDSNYVSGIQKLHAAGVVVLGYDATGYTSRGTGAVESDINTWKSLYSIDGIFFDEMSNVAGDENFYSTVSHYAKSQGYAMTVGNPGTDTLPSYIGTVDNLMIYENPGLPVLSILQGWHASYDKSNFSMIAFGVGSISTSFLASASNTVGYIDLTNDNLPNPYDSLPPYFATLVADLDTGSSSPTAPQSPTNLAATSVSSSQINLSWTTPSNNGGSAITGYKIDRSTNSGSTWSILVANTGSTGTTYSNTGLSASTTYTYRVSAINAIGTSSPSGISSATTGSVVTVPQPPTNLAATAPSSSQINLSWTAAGNGGSAITGYKVDRSIDGGTTWSTIVSNTGSTSTTYSNTGLSASTTYTYRASAINTIGTSIPSNTASATTTGISPTVPQPPTGLTSVTISSSQINLSWTVPSNNGGSAITGYKIDRSANNGSTWSTLVANTASSGTTYSDTGLVPSTTYTYQVSTINIVGTSSASNTSFATTSAGTSGSTVSVTVNSSNLSGTAFNGMWVELHASNGTTLATEYTPITFQVASGSAYTIVSSNYQNYVFNHWNDGTTAPSATITPTQNVTLTEYYSTGPTQVTLKVKSVDLSGSPISGLWTVIKSNGVVVAKGYTTLTFTATPGTTYTISVSNYQNYVFDHWSDGSTNPIKTITPTSNVTLVAYYDSSLTYLSNISG